MSDFCHSILYCIQSNFMVPGRDLHEWTASSRWIKEPYVTETLSLLWLAKKKSQHLYSHKQKFMPQHI